MVQIEKINDSLKAYESHINTVINYFIRNFDVRNPNVKWRNGLIKRTGFLDKEHKIEYALHGSGCTIELSSGQIISFDFLENDDYGFDAFKFKVFLESNPEYVLDRLNWDNTIDKFEVIKDENGFQIKQY